MKTRALREGRRTSFLPVVLLLAISLVLAAAPHRSYATDSASGYDEPPAGVESSPAGDRVREVWDVLFWRPIYAVQLVGGVVALPIALPLSALVGSWRDSIDICVTDPAKMLARPLGQ
jgi:hypothetical protein